ncbi:MAG: polyprenyl synthetase family protein [Clostridiales bacterium]|jgi:geranylgeranyl diphosphate synthase type II|nr:polyprenyl synthetase family protein [Clostridiales bacterium]
MDDFNDVYAGLKEKFNLTLIEFLKPYERTVNENLYDAIKYSLINSGKRIRPVLCMLGARFAKKSEDEVMPFALALEMIHTYSLVHDDLPAIDNDSMRRGKMTTHIMHGEAMAIFAGDALLNLAYELMTQEVSDTADFTRLKAMQMIMKAAGPNGMLNGQAKDVDYDRCGSYFLEHIVGMYRNKTADLIRASLVSGALICGAKKAELEALSAFADSLGIYFQLQDDLLDEEEDGEKADLGPTIGDYLDGGEYENEFFSHTASRATGGSVGSIFDIAGGADGGGEAAKDAPKETAADFLVAVNKEKATFIKAAGREETQRTMEEYEDYILDALEPLGPDADELIGLFEFIKKRKN